MATPLFEGMTGQNTCRELILHPFARAESANLSAAQVHAFLTILMDAVRAKKSCIFKPLEEFTLFPRLPLELRIMIFREAIRHFLLGPYRIVFGLSHPVAPKACLAPERKLYHPPLMHVNSESRRVALEGYMITRELYPTTNLDNINIDIFMSQMCLNPYVDILLGYSVNVDGFWEEVLATGYPIDLRSFVQHLVVPYGGLQSIQYAPFLYSAVEMGADALGYQVQPRSGPI